MWRSIFPPSCVSALQCTAIFSCSPLWDVLTSTSAAREAPSRCWDSGSGQPIRNISRCLTLPAHDLWLSAKLLKRLSKDVIQSKTLASAQRVWIESRGRVADPLWENFLFQRPTGRIECIGNRDCQADKKWYFTTNYMKPRSMTFQMLPVAPRIPTLLRLNIVGWTSAAHSNTVWNTESHLCCPSGLCDMNRWLKGHVLYQKPFLNQPILYNVQTQYCTRRSSYLIFTHEAKYEKKTIHSKDLSVSFCSQVYGITSNTEAI